MTVDITNDDCQRDLDDWSLGVSLNSELLALPIARLPASDGSSQSLNDTDQNELTDHLKSAMSLRAIFVEAALSLKGLDESIAQSETLTRPLIPCTLA